VLDVCRRGEQPTNLFRAENNGEAARLAGRHDLVGKIAALQRDSRYSSELSSRYKLPRKRFSRRPFPDIRLRVK
jgi:hypothetical protein